MNRLEVVRRTVVVLGAAVHRRYAAAARFDDVTRRR